MELACGFWHALLSYDDFRLFEILGQGWMSQVWVVEESQTPTTRKGRGKWGTLLS
jgi:hypothetical protein